MVLEVSFSNPFVGDSAANQTPVLGKAVDDPHFRLALLDPATHVILWTLAEHVEYAVLQGNRDKNFDQALANLVGDLRPIAGHAPVATSTP